MSAEKISPLVSPKWTREFVVELRLREVPGSAIGDALEHVRSFCADSGEDADSAFGDAAAYAGSLSFAAEPSRSRRRRLSAVIVVAGVAGIVGVIGALASGIAWASGAAPEVSLGTILAVFLIAAVLALVAFSSVPLRQLSKHPVWAYPVVLVVVAAVVGLPVLLAEPALVLPLIPLAALAVVLLVGSGVVLRRNVKSSDVELVVPDVVSAASAASAASGERTAGRG